MAAVLARDIVKTFGGEVPAVNGITLTVPDGGVRAAP